MIYFKPFVQYVPKQNIHLITVNTFSKSKLNLDELKKEIGILSLFSKKVLEVDSTLRATVYPLACPFSTCSYLWIEGVLRLSSTSLMRFLFQRLTAACLSEF